MSYPHWWNSTATLYHKNLTKDINGRTQTNWVRCVLKNCYFGTIKKQTISSNILSIVDSFILRVPYSSTITISRGDIIVKGEIIDEIPINSSGNGIKEKYRSDYFIANTVKENISTKKLKHIFASEV